MAVHVDPGPGWAGASDRNPIVTVGLLNNRATASLSSAYLRLAPATHLQQRQGGCRGDGTLPRSVAEPGRQMSEPHPHHTGTPPNMLLSVQEAADVLRIHRATVYDLIASGALRSVKIGRRRLVPWQALDTLIAACEREGL